MRRSIALVNKHDDDEEGESVYPLPPPTLSCPEVDGVVEPDSNALKAAAAAPHATSFAVAGGWVVWLAGWLAAFVTDSVTD